MVMVVMVVMVVVVVMMVPAVVTVVVAVAAWMAVVVRVRVSAGVHRSVLRGGAVHVSNVSA